MGSQSSETSAALGCAVLLKFWVQVELERVGSVGPRELISIVESASHSLEINKDGKQFRNNSNNSVYNI